MTGSGELPEPFQKRRFWLSFGTTASPLRRSSPATATSARRHPARTSRSSPCKSEVTRGLRPNVARFSLLVLVNAFVGSMTGFERTVVPLIATLSFTVTFGVVKAFCTLHAGRLSDAWGASACWSSGGPRASPSRF